MVTIQLGPTWFFGVDASLEVFAAVIAFLVAYAAYRVYKVNKQKNFGIFTLSFGLLTLSFLSRAATDAILQELMFTLPIKLVSKVFFIGYVMHILLALIAYVMLIVVTHKLTDKRIIALLYITLIPAMLMSGSYFLSFYGLSTIYLGFIAASYFKNYRKFCTSSSCLVFISFLVLALAQVMFILEAYNKLWYAAAHITQAIGYVIMLIALIRIKLK